MPSGCNRHSRPASPAFRSLSWEIYCRAIDNYGDLGVSWRLARQLCLAGEKVRLIADAPQTLRQLAPDAGGVEILPWPGPGRELPAGIRLGEADAIVEAFACELPDAALQAMAQRTAKPAWINLEYLGTEAWVEGCHLMPSPHPFLPLVKYFFFPGFGEKTGGLLAPGEKNAACQGAISRFLGQGNESEALHISLFCYAHAPLAQLLEAFARHPQPIRCLVACGLPQESLQRLLGNAPWRAGNAEFIRLPFLPQQEFDALLDACDFNFVRGEDSFVRAQWAGKPLAWQIYRQEGDAHAPKLAAFLERYGKGLAPDDAAALADFHAAWNGLAPAETLPGCWQALAGALPRLSRHAQKWRKSIAFQTDLAAKLRQFALNQV
jgi:uncharacterized repeat protein (TIGR03837 family)